MIEFWLTYNNGDEKLRLPVPPREFEIQTGNQNVTVTVHELGELLLIGKRKLKSITLSSYFPIRDDGLCQYTSFPSPAECIDMIGRWRESGRPMRLIIIGEMLKVNMPVVIENFNVSQKHGPQDIYFAMEMKEYRFLDPQQDATSNLSGSALYAYIGENRETDRVIPETYVFIEGDTLWELAKRFYGDGSRWVELMEKSGIEDEGNIALGTVIVL